MDLESGELGEGDLSSAGTESFNSKSLALQAQKKILSKMATKAVANMLIDDTSSEILDELYKVTRDYTNDKKEAHKVLKDLIKIALKIGILYRNNQFNQDEVEVVDKFKKKLNQAAMTAVSFYEVEFTFDRNVLAELLTECKDLLHILIERHLTPKSHGRIDHVFRLFADVEFLSELYNPVGVYKEYLQKICEGINKLLDEGII
ncbi:tumor necrosis factor alpha-induced protein 8-like protein 3 isoform X1 [Stegostoma tigrinum]|uniref:tumor necrosis factor alpha-induced protein 8-like protein 3 isoform X1 n=1 Tax=Stegostoma tigrinum TaxID=3053191 RepID=UPI00202B26EF|nr:tumor necrosis factor alpha-induced protein 8-like protein 3 isoform X1 [Stegostoma tigrinum]